jgi:hypothetical protein
VKQYHQINREKSSAAQQLSHKKNPSSHKKRSVSPRLNSNNISNKPTTRTTTKPPAKKQKLLPKPTGPGRNSANKMAEAQRYRMQERIQQRCDQQMAADTRTAMVQSELLQQQLDLKVQSELLQQQLDLKETFQKEQKQMNDAHQEKEVANESEIKKLREQSRIWVSSYCTLCSVPPRALPHASLTYMHRK